MPHSLMRPGLAGRFRVVGILVKAIQGVKQAVPNGFRAFSKSGYTLEDSQRFNANPLGTSG